MQTMQSETIHIRQTFDLPVGSDPQVTRILRAGQNVYVEVRQHVETSEKTIMMTVNEALSHEQEESQEGPGISSD